MHLPETVFDNLVCDETELNKNLKDQLVNLHKEIKLKFAEIQLGLREKINEINSQKITTIQVDIDFKLFSEDTVKEYFKKKLEEYYKNLITREKVYDIKELEFIPKHPQKHQMASIEKIRGKYCNLTQLNEHKQKLFTEMYKELNDIITKGLPELKKIMGEFDKMEYELKQNYKKILDPKMTEIQKILKNLLFLYWSHSDSIAPQSGQRARQPKHSSEPSRLQTCSP